MRNLDKTIVLWISLMFHALHVWGINDIRVGRMFTNKELATSVFTSFCMDAYGFMWIGTDNGLYRFDGNHYYPHRHSETDSATISDNRILGILNDRSDRLWVATANGLNLYESETNSFLRIPVKDFGENGYIISMTANDDGVAFVVSGIGIFKASVGIKGNLKINEISSSEQLSQVNSILSHSTGSLYAGTTMGDIYEIGRGIRPIKIAKVDSAVGDLAEEHGGTLIAHTENGLFRINTESGEVKKIDLSVDIKVSSLSDSVGSRIYVATFGEGVWYIDNNSDKAGYCSDLYSSVIDIRESKVGAVYSSSDGSLWVGCDFAGVLMFPTNGLSFLYRKISSVSPFFSMPISAMDVWKGNTVVGNHNGQILVVTEDGTVLKEIIIPDGGMVSSISVIENDKAVIGNPSSGIWEVELTTGKVKKLLDIPGKYISTVVCQGNDGRLYIGVYGKGLLRYDQKTGDKIWVSRDSNGKDIIPTFFTTIRAQGDYLWIGLYGGFACYDTSKGIFREIDQSPFVTGATYAVAPENERSVLVGTSHGLIRYDPLSDKAIRYTTNDGLADNDVRSIIIDRTGSRWIGTMHGLSHLDKDFQNITSYSGGYGIEETIFERMSYSEKNDIIFASGRLGITSFSPESLTIPAFKYPIRISSVYLKGKELNQSSTIDGIQVIEGTPISPEVLNLPYNENSVVLCLSSMDFRDTSNINYLWRINENEDWNELPKGTDMIHLPSLRPGSYKLEFKAKESGVESPVTSVVIRVAHPWYFTWPAKISYLLVLTALLWMTVIVIRKRHLERVNERRMKFFIDMSHDMRTPLTLLIGPLESLLKQPLESDVRNKVRMVYRNSHRILNLVNQLLDLKRIDNGRKTLECRSTFLPDFIGEIVEMFRPQALEKGIVLEYDRGEDVSDVWIDRSVVDRIVVNLISNAIKYTPEGGRIDIILRTKNDRIIGESVEIIVNDTGVGFSSSEVPDLFRPFLRLENGKSFSDEGYGLGLDICRRYARLHHGEVRGENRKDGIGGSRFSVIIPTEKDKYRPDELIGCGESSENYVDVNNPNRGIGPHLNSLSDDGRRKTGMYTESKVLVVEDDPELREQLCAYLNGFFKVRAACDGAEGYSLALEFNPDVLITDVIMPNLDGLQLIRKLKDNSDTMNIPIVILSSKSDVADRLAGWRIGAEGFLGKPFYYDELRALVKNLIDGRSILKGKFIGEVVNEINPDPSSSDIKGINDSLMDRISKILKDKIEEEDMNVDRLAQEVGLSRSQLYRRLKEHFGMTPSDLIRNIRLKRACELLRNENLDITQIAYKIGFSSQSQFSTTFKRFIGYTPTEYRMKHAGDTES